MRSTELNTKNRQTNVKVQKIRQNRYLLKITHVFTYFILFTNKIHSHGTNRESRRNTSGSVVYDKTKYKLHKKVANLIGPKQPAAFNLYRFHGKESYTARQRAAQNGKVCHRASRHRKQANQRTMVYKLTRMAY